MPLRLCGSGRQIGFAALLTGTWAAAATAEVPPTDSPAARHEAQRLAELPPVGPQPAGHIDPTGRIQKGRVSYYSHRFAHRKMADGRLMNPQSNVAASKTLPLGTMAKVTNLENGKSATVKVEDRGPFVAGRVIDVSPTVADKLDLKQQGTAPAEVKPITVPQRDGEVKLGAGAADASPHDVAEAAQTTKQLTGTTTDETAER